MADPTRPTFWWSPTAGLIRGGTNGGHDDAILLVPAEPVDEKGRTPTYLRGEADGWNAARAQLDERRRWTPELVEVVEQWRSGIVPNTPPDIARAAVARWPEMHQALDALRARYEADMREAPYLSPDVIEDDAARLRWRYLSARADHLHGRYWTTDDEDVAHLRSAFPELPQGKARRLIEDAAIRAPKPADPRA